MLAPTHELALQITEEVKKYEYRGIKSVCIYGGGNRREQMKIVAEGVEMIIATPGRLNDLVSEGKMRHPKNKVGYPWTLYCLWNIYILSVRLRPALSRWSP